MESSPLCNLLRDIPEELRSMKVSDIIDSDGNWLLVGGSSILGNKLVETIYGIPL